MIVDCTNSKNWKNYQKRLKKFEKRRSFFSRLQLIMIYGGCCLFIVAVIFFSGSWIYAYLSDIDSYSEKNMGISEPVSHRIARAELPSILNGAELSASPVTGQYILAREGADIIAETSIDTSLQNYITRFLQRSLTRQAAVIVLKPASGQILAMAGYSKDGDIEGEKICLQANLPAASLFKIVSAAAAIEARNFTPGKSLYFLGGKYTLYKNQLTQDTGRWATSTTFQSAFSGSINPVFGKIGIYDLGQELLTKYADKFLFNHEIPFDLSLGMSRIKVPDDAFGLAEIASGFNKRTLISPIHATLLTAAVANNGTVMRPWIVSALNDGAGKILYTTSPSKLANPINKNTAEHMKSLMKATVKSGTCYSAFLPLRQKKLFSNISLGAKSGTINDRNDKYKYDWLTAYAMPETGDKGISITVFAVHGEKLGIRAKDIAKYIIDYYYSS